MVDLEPFLSAVEILGNGMRDAYRRRNQGTRSEAPASPIFKASLALMYKLLLSPVPSAIDVSPDRDNCALWKRLAPALARIPLPPGDDPVPKGLALGDAHLMRALKCLHPVRAAFEAEEGCPGQEAIRHMGAVYERLLAYTPCVAKEALLKRRRRAGRSFHEECLPLSRSDRKGPARSAARKVAIEKGSFFLFRQKRGTTRKSQGSFYTPSYLVKYMVKEVLDPFLGIGDEPKGAAGPTPEEILRLKVLDPAMGTGHFLVAVVDELARAYAEALLRKSGRTDVFRASRSRVEHRRIVCEHCIFGVDLDPMAAALARLSLKRFIQIAPDAPSALDRHLVTGDALNDDWILSVGGAEFSAVVGNPPYGDVLSKEEKVALQDQGYPSTGGRAEIAALFLYQGLRLLSHEGRLCFLLPNTLLDGKQFSRLRAEISARSRVRKITDFRSGRVFPEAEVYAMILLLEAEAAPRPVYDATYCCPKPGSTEAPSERIRIHRASGSPWRKVIPFVEALKETGWIEPLSPGIALCRDGGLDYKYKNVGWPMRGIRPSLAKVLTYTGPCRHPQDPFLLRGSDLTPFRIRGVDRYLVHDWKRFRSEETQVLVYPELMEVPVKILTRQTSDRLIAAIDREGRYTAKSVHTIIVQNEDYTPEFICALLNSSVMNRIYREYVGEEGRTFAQVKVSELRELPVRKVSPYLEGRRHPLWLRHETEVTGRIAAGAFTALQPLAERLFQAEGVLQALVTEVVRCIERNTASDSYGKSAIRFLDGLFSRLYGLPASKHAVSQDSLGFGL
jgi:hypothetical protein